MTATNDRPDAPLFDPAAFGLSDQQVDLTTRARVLGQTKFAERAARFDREAIFPTENYADLRDAGLLAICVPRAQGGAGADFKTYMLTVAEIGRYCGATALTWNMHVCSCLWSGDLADDIEMDADIRAGHDANRAVHYRRIVKDGAIYAQPFSEGGATADLTASNLAGNINNTLQNELGTGSWAQANGPDIDITNSSDGTMLSWSFTAAGTNTLNATAGGFDTPTNVSLDIDVTGGRSLGQIMDELADQTNGILTWAYGATPSTPPDTWATRVAGEPAVTFLQGSTIAD